MLISKKTFVKWNSKNKKYYTQKGYVFTKIGEAFEVDIDDLSPSSKSEVLVSCDFCGREITKKYQVFNTQHDEKYGDCCKDCQPKKNKLVCQERYGMDNGSQTQHAIDKIKSTCMERYGVDNGSKTEEAREKIKVSSNKNKEQAMASMKKTMLKRYGVENAFQSEAIKEKMKNTMINRYGVSHPKKSKEIKEKERQRNKEKYGVEYYSQTKESKEKSKRTCLEKYGCEYSLQSPIVREKIVASLLKNGSCPTSKQQIELYEILKSLYGQCELNKPCGRCLLDCAIVVDGQPIDVEYDGAYWHQDTQRDRRRDEFIKAQGYKIFRIIGEHKVPSTDLIKFKIEKLLNSKNTFTQIKMV